MESETTTDVHLHSIITDDLELQKAAYAGDLELVRILLKTKLVNATGKLKIFHSKLTKVFVSRS